MMGNVTFASMQATEEWGLGGRQGGDSIALKKGPKKGPKVNLLQAYA